VNGGTVLLAAIAGLLCVILPTGCGLVERACGAGGSGQGASPEERFHERSRVRGDGLPPRAPNPWFYIERAYPLGRIPHERWKEARNRAANLKAKKEGRRSVTWTPRGPTNIGGRVTDIAVDPVDENIVFAGAAEGGVLRSLDGGQTWTPLFDDQLALAIGALAIDPSNSMRIYAGTGEVNPGGGSVAYGGAGLFRSENRGDTWTYIGLEESGAIGRIRIDPNDPNRIFAAAMGALWENNSERGVYRTTDGGTAWQRVLYIDDATGCVDLIMRPDNPSVLLAAMWERVRRPEYYSYGGSNCAVYRSLDGGDTWSLLGGGLPTPTSNSGRIGLSLCAAQPDVMHAIYADKTGYFDGLYRSIDGGDSWARTNDGSLSYVFASYGWWFGNVRTHPADPDRIFVLGLDFYRSINGGTLWSKLPDLPITQIYRVALDANNANALYGGAQDNGTCRTLTGSTSNWSMIFGGDGFQSLVHPLNSNRIWVQYQYGSLYYSSNGGSGFSGATGGISGLDRRNWNSPLIQDPTDSDRRYFGTNKVYRSSSNTSWTAISPDLTGGSHMGQSGQVMGTLTTLAVSPLDGDVIWAGSDDGHVSVTVNGGGSWTDVSAVLPDRWITSVRADPTSRETAYVTISGFRWAEPLPRVYMTTDLGAVWVSISGNLPDAPVNDFIADPDVPGRCFAATDVGVFETLDGGGTWNVLGSGLPNVVVTSLALDEANRELFAGTYGRSFFSCSVETGTITQYGQGLAGSGGFVPELDGSGDVIYGGQVTVGLVNGLGGAQGTIVVGPSGANYPVLGGTLLVGYPFIGKIPIVLDGTPGVPGAGTWSQSATQYVSNTAFYVQAFIYDSGAAQGVAMSNGLELVYP